MAKLTEAQKAFIVVRLACFDQPSEVVEAVKLEFDLEATRQQVNAYNPETAEGKRLSDTLKQLFHDTRARFLENVQEIPIASQAYRLRELQKLYQSNPKNTILRASLLEQAAKEAGGVYTNKVQIFQQLARDVEKLSDAELHARLVGSEVTPAVLPSGSVAPGLVATNGNGKHAAE